MPTKAPAPSRPVISAPEPAARPRASHAPVAQLAPTRSSGGGESLPSSVAAPISTSFGVDVSSIRVHSGGSAAAAARTVGATAFAQGSDIVLGSSARANDLPLMAHEVAHVVQQQSAPRVQLWSPGATDRYEHEAHQASEAVVHGRPFTVRERTTPRVQRFPNVLDWIAEKANVIPGFRMFTLILGVNPINMSSVERSGANILRAVIELIPGGGVITQALEGYGIFEKAGAWAEGQFKALGMVGRAFKQAIDDFIDQTSAWSVVRHPIRTWERAKRIFTDPIDRLIAFGKGLVTGFLKLIRDAVLMPLAKLAKGTKGWPLLIAVLGEDPITREKVPRDPESIIGGFMILAGQQDVFENMKKAKALPRAWSWFVGAMKDLWGLVSGFPGRVIDTLKSLTFTDFILLPRVFIKIGAVLGGFVFDFLNWAGNAAWKLLEIIFDVVSPSAWGYIKKTGAALRSILKNPLPFVGNLVKAAKSGFQNFASNIGAHFKAGLIDWLTGSLPGVYIPKAFSLGEIVTFVFSVLGISWANVRVKLVKVVGEGTVKAMEDGFALVKTLVTEGPAAAWEQIKESLSNLKDMVIGGITDFVIDTVKNKAIPKLIAMFIPGAGFISAILSIYDTVMVFVQKISKIIQVVTGFIDSIVSIAGGNISAAAKRVEGVLAGLLSLAINFLAGFAGLGKVADKLMGVIAKARASVDKGLDALVAWVVKMAKALFTKVFGKKEQAKGAADVRTPQQKSADVAAAVSEAQDLLNANGATPQSVRAQLAGLKTKYGLTRAVLEEVGPTEYDVAVEINPVGKTPKKKFDPSTIKVKDVIRVRFQTPESARAGFLESRAEFSEVRYRYIPADVTDVTGTAISYKTRTEGVSGTVQQSGYETTWIRFQPGTSFAVNAAWQKIKVLNVWSNREDARQVLNWRYHKKFSNPGGKQWEHIIEQTAGGPHTVDNLALTTAQLNADFNVFFGRAHGSFDGLPSTNNLRLRDFLKGKPQSDHIWWKMRCYAIFRVRVVPKSQGTDGEPRGPYQTLDP